MYIIQNIFSKKPALVSETVAALLELWALSILAYDI